jgi:hypothetical protein
VQTTSNALAVADVETLLGQDYVGTDRKVSERAARASRARHSSKRRQKIDPTTCEREYSPAELEFMKAIQNYKNASGRMFPTWSEVLEVLQGLGYEKTA